MDDPEGVFYKLLSGKKQCRESKNASRDCERADNFMSRMQINSTDIQETLDFTKRAVSQYGPRLTGTPVCKNAALMVAAELKRHCDQVKIEEFAVFPEAFRSLLRTAAIIYILSALLLYFDYLVVASVGFLLVAFLVVGQIFLYWQISEPFCKEKRGYNVFGTMEPAGEAKQQIIISGHHDSAHVFNFLRRYQKLYAFRIIPAMLAVFAAPVFSLIWIYFHYVTGRSPVFAVYFQYGVLLSLIFVAPMYFFMSKEISPGAGDNMVATAMVIKLAQLFRQAREERSDILRHTRLIFLSTDAEEAGLRGARAFARQHKAELLALPAYNFNIDSIYNLKELQFLTTDINSTVSLSREMARQCKNIAAELGYATRLFAITPGGGGTDAAEFARIGVQATTLIGMPTNLIRDGLVYHTANDTVEHIEPAAVEASLKITLEYILRKDRESF